MSRKKPRSDKAKEAKAGKAGERLEVLLLFALALVLRVVGISWGLPGPTHAFSYHPDEVHVLLPALGMLRGDWNPHFFNYGTLYLYLVGIVSWAFALIGLSPANAPDFAPLYLIGRTISAVLGAGTVVLVYLICRELGGRRLALWGSGLLAIAPLPLVNSHFATVDVAATFFLVLGAYGCVKVISDGRERWYLLSGAAMGFAAATKYNFGAGILLLVAAHLLRRRRAAQQELELGLLWGLLAFPLFFLIGCPYTLSLEGGLHLREQFLQGLLFETRHMQEVRTPAFVGSGSGWAYHALRGFPAALGIPLYALALAGIVWFLISFRRREPILRKGLFLLAGWLVFFFLITGFATERFIRYLVPLVPFLCIFAAWLVDEGLSLTSRLRVPALVGMAAATLLTLVYSLAQLLLFLAPDPRDRAYAALAELRPKSVGVQEVPWFRTPPVSPYNAGIFSLSDFLKWQETAPYRVIVTGWQKRVLLREKPEVFTISDLQYADFLRLHDERARDFMTALKNSYRERRVFRNAIPLEWVGGGQRRSPPDWLYLKPVVSLYFDWK